MAKIMVLGDSGNGKTTSVIGSKKLKIRGANPAESYIITSTTKEMGTRWSTYPGFGYHTTAKDLKDYRRIVAKEPGLAAHAINLLGQTPIKNIFLDDTNYYMQDMYMAKALSSGWDTPKKIGFEFNKIVMAIEALPMDKHFIMFAHGEEYTKSNGKLGYRMKTTGKMVQEYVTPEGKMDIVLVADSEWDDINKIAKKVFITRDNGIYTIAKCQGIFDELAIPNDMGYILKAVTDHYNSLQDDEWDDEPEEEQKQDSTDTATPAE